jgi:hypothetical protein
MVSYCPVFYKFFPFSGGIRWEIAHGKYIHPQIDLDTWNRALEDKDIIVVAFGGLLETLFSLTFVEALKILRPNQNLYWLGSEKYSNLHFMNGGSKNCNINLTPKILKNYPTPIFFDADNRVYFNVLNNFLLKKSYWNRYPLNRTETVFEQIFSNLSVPWSKSYLPKLRNIGTDFIDGLIKANRINSKSKIITIILENTDKDILKWGTQQIKEFVQIASSRGFKVVVFSHDISRFYGSKILVFEYDVRKILQTIKTTKLLLSNNINWLLSSLLISETAIVCKNESGPYDIFKNAEYIEVENDIFSYQESVSTLDVLAFAEGI